MRCSSCEIVLDRYVEGTLSPRRMAAVTAHLQTCDACAFLLGELRVVDALLATTKAAELAPNFTFAVMAEVRGAAVPQARSLSLWAVLSFYVVAAWIGLTGLVLASGGHPAWLGTAFGSLRAGFANTTAALAGAAQGVGPAAPFVVGIVAGVLALDVLLAALFIVLYRTVRPRLAARLARSESP